MHQLALSWTTPNKFHLTIEALPFKADLMMVISIQIQSAPKATENPSQLPL